MGFLHLFSRLTATQPDIYLLRACFVSLHLLCYGAVSSKVYQEVAAMQVQTLVGKILEGEWIQTPPRFASSPDSREAGEKWTTRKIVLQMAIVFVSGNDTATGLGDE